MTTAQPTPDDTAAKAAPPESGTDNGDNGLDIPSDNDGPTLTTADTTVDHNLPLEYQYLEIDLSNNNLDPFEYIFRKYIPIPRIYFWETASSANDHHKQLPFKIKLWHRSIYYLGGILHKAEAGGEVIANFLGLNDGPFDYVTQNITEEEMARSCRNILERRGASAAEGRREGDV